MKSLVPELKEGINYFNWDVAAHRKILSTQIFSGKTALLGEDRKIIVFDEIHKYPRWKNALKGLFDQNEPSTHWIVTGSAAMNVYKKGQDSLVGRSFTYHLFPFSVAEIVGKKDDGYSIDQLIDCSFSTADDQTNSIFEKLMNYGGFPEPFMKESEAFLSKWRTSRLDKMVNQDLSSIEHLKNMSLVEQLIYLLPDRVGSPLSINSLREDLEVHFTTAKHWIELLERIFYGFSVSPYSEKLSRAFKKERKWYLWDWTEIENKGYRFENLVAVHLFKFVNYVNDLGLGKTSLHYLRDKEKREVDFMICKDKKPFILIECKHGDVKPSDSLFYFSKRLKAKRTIQLTAENIQPAFFKKDDVSVEVVPAASFLRELV